MIITYCIEATKNIKFMNKNFKCSWFYLKLQYLKLKKNPLLMVPNVFNTVVNFFFQYLSKGKTKIDKSNVMALILADFTWNK